MPTGRLALNIGKCEYKRTKKNDTATTLLLTNDKDTPKLVIVLIGKQSKQQNTIAKVTPFFHFSNELFIQRPAQVKECGFKKCRVQICFQNEIPRNYLRERHQSHEKQVHSHLLYERGYPKIQRESRYEYLLRLYLETYSASSRRSKIKKREWSVCDVYWDIL